MGQLSRDYLQNLAERVVGVYVRGSSRQTRNDVGERRNRARRAIYLWIARTSRVSNVAVEAVGP